MPQQLDQLGIPSANQCLTILQGGGPSRRTRSATAAAAASSIAASATSFVAGVLPLLPATVTPPNAPSVTTTNSGLQDFPVQVRTVSYRAPATLVTWTAASSATTGNTSNKAAVASAAAAYFEDYHPNQKLAATRSRSPNKKKSKTTPEECAICLEDLILPKGKTTKKAIIQLKGCGHVFHKECILDALQHSAKCPTCRAPLSTGKSTAAGADNSTSTSTNHSLIQGTCPSGTLRIRILQNQACPGFSDAPDTIELSYSIPNGTQAVYHDSPGTRFTGAHRTAYLPHNLEGRRLLQRLVFAFTHGLTFRVGTSLTSGATNVVTWGSIHHKTTLYGGAHGFPDASYVQNCNDALTALSVPRPEDC